VFQNFSKNLKLIALSNYNVICECNEEIQHNYRCIECHQKFIGFLSKIMIKVLHLRYSDLSHSLINSLKNFQNLQTISLFELFDEMKDLQNYRLTEAFIEI
jgi:hypothetical protein